MALNIYSEHERGLMDEATLRAAVDELMTELRHLSTGTSTAAKALRERFYPAAVRTHYKNSTVAPGYSRDS